MNDLDRAKVALESQKSELIGTVDEIRQDLATQKVCIHLCSCTACEGVRPGSRPRKIWRVVVGKDRPDN